MSSYVGSKVSIISKTGLRFEGTISFLDEHNAILQLKDCVCKGSENRSDHGYVPPSDDVYELIEFKGSEISDLQLLPSLPYDPAIINAVKKEPQPSIDNESDKKNHTNDQLRMQPQNQQQNQQLQQQTLSQQTNTLQSSDVDLSDLPQQETYHPQQRRYNKFNNYNNNYQNNNYQNNYQNNNYQNNHNRNLWSNTSDFTLTENSELIEDKEKWNASNSGTIAAYDESDFFDKLQDNQPNTNNRAFRGGYRGNSRGRYHNNNPRPSYYSYDSSNNINTNNNTNTYNNRKYYNNERQQYPKWYNNHNNNNYNNYNNNNNNNHNYNGYNGYSRNNHNPSYTPNYNKYDQSRSIEWTRNKKQIPEEKK